MLVQVYALPASIENKLMAQPAQFVFESNATNMVIGFIVGVDEQYLTICLFEPKKHSVLPRDAVALQSSVDVPAYLRKALDANPDMKSEWISLINDGNSKVDS